MLDIALLRKDLDGVLAKLAKRKNPQPFLDEARFRELEAERKTIQTRTEELQAQRNSLSKQIGMLKGKATKGEDTAAQVEAVMAEVAGMSRSVFAASFREAMGTTPGQYLQGWRVGLAQQALRQGRPLKRIADEVGYGSEAALSRAFKAHSGVSPRAWRQARAAREAVA